ncbi:hypothetical protein [Rhizobium sp. PP-CC-3G-465]|uniref:hypothetical protein n=1 Tax=Rhizobium sp. PP-CC-3G-465 TaxID=2135648 RepID=UPI00104EFF43|nr:hypothetical protein C8J33_101876 [Rhizobium sp. PP-CC-3G-465]
MNAHATATPFNMDKFRKLHAHVTQNDNQGERENARRMADAMAAKAGMTFDEAVSKMDATGAGHNSGPASADAASAGADSCERERRQQEQQQANAFWERHKSEREKRYQANAARRAEVLTRYKNIFAVFEQTEREHALRSAVSWVSMFQTFKDPTGKDRRFTYKLGRQTGGVYLDKLPKKIRKAIQNAYAWPSTLAEALDEVKSWNQIRRDRDVFDRDDWKHDMEVEARILLLEEMLQKAPVQT